MIKLSDILKETSITNYVGEIGYLWPFADTEGEADNWENTRLKNIFKGSLKNWSQNKSHTQHTIMHQHHIHQTNHQRAGVASDDIHIHSDYEFVKDMYDKDMVDLYLSANVQPDPEKKY